MIGGRTEFSKIKNKNLIELEFIKDLQKALDYKVTATVFLRRFDNDKKVELLHLLILHELDVNYNLTQILDLMRTSPQSNASISAFVRTMVKAGALQEIGDISGLGKKSSKYLRASGPSKQEYLHYIKLISGQIM